MTGGESFFLGTQAPVSFSPYLEQLQRILDNQYLLTFSAAPGKKAGLQYVTVTTEVAGVDFSTQTPFGCPPRNNSLRPQEVGPPGPGPGPFLPAYCRS